MSLTLTALPSPPARGSPRLAMAPAAGQRLAGRDIVGLALSRTLDEPDFASPHVAEGAREAEGRPLGYAPANGMPALEAQA
jgi:hypothetical protein